LKGAVLVAIAAAAFVAIFVFAMPFPLIILAAAAAGWFFGRPGADGHGAAKDGEAGEDALIDAQFAQALPDHVKPRWSRLVVIAAVGLVLWFLPLAISIALLGPGNVLAAIAAFNAKMAVVTFGGAYAVLSYMAQQAVAHYHWLKPDEMLVGLGLAETTPGPLISVVQFVGYLAEARAPGGLDPVWAGTLGGLIAMWSTFVPSFLWIFMGGPYVEALIGNQRLNAALSAVTGAVVGVILNLALWLAIHTLFAASMQIGPLSVPVLASINWAAAAIATGAMVAIFHFRCGIIPVLAASCVAGLGLHFAQLA